MIQRKPVQNINLNGPAATGFPTIRVLLFTLSLLILILPLPDCASYKTRQPPPSIQHTVETPGFSLSGETTPDTLWWESFQDDRLNQLVAEALRNNLDLQSIWHRLQAAKWAAASEKGDLWPQVQLTTRGATEVTPSEPKAENSLNMGLSASYEIDLWGRINAAVKGKRYEARAAYRDYQTAALSLAAEICGTWFQLTEARQQLTLIASQVEINSKMVEMMHLRLGNGQIRGVDILRQKRLLEATIERKTEAETNITLLEHQLALLLGKPPHQTTRVNNNSTELQPPQPPLQAQLPQLPPLPQTGIPAELIQRRPDVQSAFNRLMAADHNLAEAIRNRYPRLSLSTSLDKYTDTTRDLFKNWVRSLAANLLMPIFQGGRLRAEANRAHALKEERLNQYGQKILEALKEVEDALIRESKQQILLKSISTQLTLAEQAHTQLREEYFHGISDYLDVLSAQETQQQLQRSQLTAQRRLLEYRTALYRALAGGLTVPSELNHTRQRKNDAAATNDTSSNK